MKSARAAAHKFANQGESLERNGTEIADRRATSKDAVTQRLDEMTLGSPTNDQSEINFVQSTRSPETEVNDHWVIYESMDKMTLSRTPSFRAHSRLQSKMGYDPAFRGPTGQPQNALHNDGAHQAPGGPTQAAANVGDLLDRCELENDSRVTRYVHPLNVGRDPTCVRQRVTTPALMVTLRPPNYNSKDNSGAEPCSPPSTHTEPISHEDATDDHKITHGGVERWSPPENRTMTTVRSPAPRPTRRRNLIRNCDGGAEPCFPSISHTTLTTYKNNISNHGQVNGGAERRSPPRTCTLTTVRSPAPRPWHYPNHTVDVTYDPTKGPDQQLGLHPVLIVTPRLLQLSQRLQSRNCRNTAFSHRIHPFLPTHLAWHCRWADRERRRTPGLPPSNWVSQGHQKCPPSPHASPTPTATPAAVLPRAAARRQRPNRNDSTRTRPLDVAFGGTEGRRETVKQGHGYRKHQ